MHFNLSLFAIAAIVAPVLAAKTWDVNFVNGTFSPQELDIAPGDTVRWPNNDGANHAIVQTIAGARNCTSMPNGFNSGVKTKGQAYERVFPNATTINYKDGVDANCAKGATGTIYVHTGARPSNSTTPSGPSNSATTSGPSNSATTSGTRTAAPISSPTHHSAANGLSVEKSVILGVTCFIGALAL
ncbi:hypothetical protein CPC16_006307 [Podila verticillata]|nr:hypothetical protein BGZ52_010571 [Haplosporangium bisporale]KAF9208543.1 hypothetical protein BGZ59_010597 [Podila verticillata]KAF9388643.1 hypothetical protein CPC16_006307 [Podila verticillata]KAI9239134.1 MAG: hypothetical protein BYD32DRAFT_479119 [Podila humilis]KFH72593.1 hypothetical protein MVEG_02882 [Podila verticillata NRRL 6337]